MRAAHWGKSADAAGRASDHLIDTAAGEQSSEHMLAGYIYPTETVSICTGDNQAFSHREPDMKQIAGLRCSKKSRHTVVIDVPRGSSPSGARGVGERPNSGNWLENWGSNPASRSYLLMPPKIRTADL
jgi:hypothetical protein